MFFDGLCECTSASSSVCNYKLGLDQKNFRVLRKKGRGLAQKKKFTTYDVYACQQGVFKS